VSFRNICLVSGLILSLSTPLSAENAHLSVHVQGIHRDNTWFLCIPHEGGCFSLNAATHGKVFPLTPGKIQQAFILNTKKLNLSALTLP
jgi:hypothetical protein